MLDVAIGITFTFLLLSLICTALQEIIEAFLKKRASDLEKGIRELLQDTTPNAEGIVADLYRHSLLSGLYKGPYIPLGNKMPTYIPASNFTIALLDIVLPGTATNLSGSVGGGTPSSPGTIPVPPTSVTVKSLTPLRNAITNLPVASTNLKNALLPLIDAAGDDIDKARSNIENWYNTSMDRVSGWYKRRTQKVLIVLGLLLSLAMNADTIAIYKSLLNDPPLRNSLVSAAQEYAKTIPNDTSSARDRVDENAKKLYALRLPIGWDWNDNGDVSINNKYLALPWSDPTIQGDSSKQFFSYLLKLIGWLITALAISLGAPFWFDTLNKIMVVRSTVKPHEKSPEEASDDRQNPKGK